jgi:hypothetical protein
VVHTLWTSQLNFLLLYLFSMDVSSTNSFTSFAECLDFLFIEP